MEVSGLAADNTWQNQGGMTKTGRSDTLKKTAYDFIAPDEAAGQDNMADKVSISEEATRKSRDLKRLSMQTANEIVKHPGLALLAAGHIEYGRVAELLQ